MRQKTVLSSKKENDKNCKGIIFYIKPRNKNNGGYEFQYRLIKGGEMKAVYPAKFDGTPEFPVNYPNTWIRLKRTGNDFTGLFSLDGKKWKVYTTFTLELAKKVYLGMAVTSHNIKEPASAVFKDISLIK
jgi:regulation of enolase protein 1 (concanavalin A-like superfamily)